MRRCLIVLSVTGLLVACGSNGDSASVDSGVPTQETSAPDESSPAVSAAPAETADLSGFEAGPPVDACALLTDVEVQALVGSIVPGVAENHEPLFFGCRWETDATTVVISVISHGDADAARTSFGSYLGDFETIEGVGDAALSNIITDIAFISGAYEATIFLSGDHDDAAHEQRVREVALTIIPRLP